MPPTAPVDDRPEYMLDDTFVEQEQSGLSKSFRRFDDSHLTRFMWAAGDDIDVKDRSGGRFWGLYKNEVIPKRRLVPVRHARTLSIMELPVIGVTAETASLKHLAGFEAEAIAGGMERQNSMALSRAPRTVAYEIMGEYEDTAYGPALFEHAQLMGDDRQDLVLKLYRAIVPRSVFADPGEIGNLRFHGEGVLKPQTRKGVKFLGLVTGTFLDQWVTYLNEYAALNVQRANLPRHKPRAGSVEGTDDPLSENDLALLMLARMQEAAARAWTHQTAYLDSSRNQIIGKRNGGTGKVWYDERDERYLLETATLPLNLEEVAAASRAAEANESAIMKGIEKIVERINPPVSQTDVASQIQRQVEESLGNLLDAMSPEQLQAILARKQRAQETLEASAVATAARADENRRKRREAEQAAKREASQPAVEEPAASVPDENAPIDGDD